MEQVAMTQMPSAQMVNGLNDYGIYNRYHRHTRRRQTRVYITTRVSCAGPRQSIFSTARNADCGTCTCPI